MIVLDVEQTAYNLKQARRIKGVRICDICRHLSIQRTAIYKWECGEHMPTVDHFVMLSDLYDVPIDLLVARKEV